MTAAHVCRVIADLRYVAAAPRPACAPTAVCAAAEVSVSGAIQAARAFGLAIPAAAAPLSTIVQPIHAMARAAIRLLVDLVQARALPARQLQVPTRLVVRSSCRRYAGDSAPPVA